MVCLVFTGYLRPIINRSVCIPARFVTSGPSNPRLTAIPPPPKRPINAYFAFLNDNIAKVIEESPGIKRSAVISQVAELWRELTSDIKKAYEEKSAKRMSDYKATREKWWNNLTTVQQDEFLKARQNKKNKGMLKLLSKPRRRTAFSFYMMTNLQGKAIKDSISYKETFSKVASQWKDMTAEDRKPFEEMRTKDLENYEKKLTEWEAKNK